MKPEKSHAGRPPREGETANAQIQLRTTMDRKNAYVKAAKPRKLTEWIFEKLDKESGYRPKENAMKEKEPSNEKDQLPTGEVPDLRAMLFEIREHCAKLQHCAALQIKKLQEKLDIEP